MAEIYIPRMTDAINAFEAGRQGALERQKQQAAQMIGGAMARGDYRSAAEAAFGAGDYATGLKIEEVGRERQARDRRANYGQQYAAGRGKEAVAEAYGAGDFEIGGELQQAINAASKAEKEFMQQKAERIAAIVAPLGDIPETDMVRRKAYIAEHRADLLAAGYTDEQLASFEPTNANLAPIYSQALGLKDYLSNQREDAKFAAQEADRRADNERADKQLGVSQGNLAQRRVEHAARMAGKGGYAAPGAAVYDDLPAGAQVVR